MTEAKSRPGVYSEARDMETGRMIPVEVLTAEEAKARRALDRARRETEAELRREASAEEQGLRVLRSAMRQAGRGQAQRAVGTVMAGFAEILLDAALRAAKPRH